MEKVSEIGVIRALESGSRRAQFFECLPVACYACDCAGTITDYNRRAVELLGREPQATDRFTVAHKVLDAQGNPLAPEATATAFLIRSGLTQINREVTIERPDGKRMTVLSNVAPLFDAGGNMIGALDVLQDITDRRWLEDARRVAERVKASARVATEVAQLKPALLSMLSTLELLNPMPPSAFRRAAMPSWCGLNWCVSTRW
jgi:PAS domain S-box